MRLVSIADRGGGLLPDRAFIAVTAVIAVTPNTDVVCHLFVSSADATSAQKLTRIVPESPCDRPLLGSSKVDFGRQGTTWAGQGQFGFRATCLACVDCAGR